MKGISPLIASVLLIAITMTLAAILASFVSTYTQTQLTGLSSCVGGTITFATAVYPKINSNNIDAIIEVGGVDLNEFKIEYINSSDNEVYSVTDTGSSIDAGSSGLISATFGDLTAGDDVRVVAGNCPDVRTGWVPLKS
jgi:flagellin-like protein